MARNKQKPPKEYRRKPGLLNYITCGATIFSALGCCIAALLSYCTASTANQISQRVADAQILEKQPLIKSYVLHDTLWVNLQPSHRGITDVNVVALNNIYTPFDTSRTFFVYSEKDSIRCSLSLEGVFCTGGALMGQSKVNQISQQKKFFGKSSRIVPINFVEIEYLDIYNKKQKQYFTVVANSNYYPSDEDQYLNAQKIEVITDSTKLDSLLQILDKKTNDSI